MQKFLNRTGDSVEDFSAKRFVDHNLKKQLKEHLYTRQSSERM